MLPLSFADNRGAGFTSAKPVGMAPAKDYVDPKLSAKERRVNGDEGTLHIFPHLNYIFPHILPHKYTHIVEVCRTWCC